MNRMIELFLRKGTVLQLPSAVTKNKSSYGLIEMQDSFDPKNGGTKIVYSSTNLSFSNVKSMPKLGQDVYFFLVPMEYLVPLNELPKNPDKSIMLAVNISAKRPVLEQCEGPVTRHPCGTVISPPPDPSRSYIHYAINDFGELFMFHSKHKFKPWDKVVMKPSSPMPYSQDSSLIIRACSPKLKGANLVTSELLYLELDESIKGTGKSKGNQARAGIDPGFYWDFK